MNKVRAELWYFWSWPIQI